MTIDITLLSWYFIIFCASYNAIFLFLHLLLVRYPGLLKSRVDRDGQSPPGRQIDYLTILVPARDEALVIRDTVCSLICALEVQVTKHQYEIVVIDDASEDDTLRELKQLQKVFPDQLLICERHPPQCREGKGEALNAGLKLLGKRFPGRDSARWIVGVFDADANCQSDIFVKVVSKFENQNIDAIQCAVHISNTASKWLPILQDIEFLSFAGVMQPVRNAVSGAVMLGGNAQFSTMEALEGVQEQGVEAWNPLALTEDLDLALRLHCKGARISFCPSYVNQQGLETMGALMRQRLRWGWGIVQVFVWYLLKKSNLWASSIPWYRKVDIVYYLSFWFVPLLVLLSWALSIAALLTPLEIHNSFNPWLLILISFSYLPIFAIGVYGKYPLRRPRTWFLLLVAVFYTYHWIPAVMYGLLAVLFRRTPVWNKTARIVPAQSS
ncbi:MAG: glycosyltransferase family 2 protein [Anaerolineae bacterium]|nr:MAG: glycosyltransferase family 2 protein [Anaerolineae bacterium]